MLADLVMLRYIFIGLLIYIVLRVLRKYLFIRSVLRSNGSRDKKPGQDVYNDMVKCARCGVYVHKNSAVVKDDKWLCSTDCLK